MLGLSQTHTVVLSTLVVANLYTVPLASGTIEVLSQIKRKIQNTVASETSVISRPLPEDLSEISQKFQIDIQEHALSSVHDGALNPEIYCIDEGLPREGDMQIAGAGILHTTSVGFHADPQYKQVFQEISDTLHTRLHSKTANAGHLQAAYTVDHYSIDPAFDTALRNSIRTQHLQSIVAHGDCGAAKLALKENIQAILHDQIVHTNVTEHIDETALTEEVMSHLPEEIIDHHAYEFAKDMADRFHIDAGFIPMVEHARSHQHNVMQREHHKHKAHGIVIAEHFSLKSNLEPLEKANIIGGDAFHLTLTDFGSKEARIAEHVENIILAILIQLDKKPLPHGEKFSILFVRNEAGDGLGYQEIAPIIERVAKDERVLKRRTQIVFQIVDTPKNN